MADLIVWKPRISGVLPYDIAGGTKYDVTQLNGEGAVDNSNPQGTKILMGDITGYGIPPALTLAQLQASTSESWNQLIGLCNYLANQVNTAHGSSIPQMPYLFGTLGYPSDPTLVTNIRLMINQIRTTQGVAAFVFKTTITSKYQVKACVMAELRSALNITAVTTIYQLSAPITAGCKSQQYAQTEPTFNSTAGATTGLVSVVNADVKAALIHNSGGNGQRIRICFDIPVPAGIVSVTSVKLTFKPHTLLNGAGAFTVGWYASNTDDFALGAGSPGSGRAFNTNQLIASVGDVSLASGVPITLTSSDNTKYIARAGGHFSSILALTQDVAGFDYGSSTVDGLIAFAAAGDLFITVTP